MDMTKTLDSYLANYRKYAESRAQNQANADVDAEAARLKGVSVLPGQSGVEYHFSVYRRDGMYYDAYDLQDAQVMADNLAVYWIGGAKVVRNSDGRVMSYHGYSDSKERVAARAA